MVRREGLDLPRSGGFDDAWPGRWSVTGRPRVLVVDDDADVRDSLRRSLRFEGYEVSVAADGDEVFSQLADNRPDLLILDLQMPRMDGLAVCRRLRAEGDAMPVLMLTARDGTSDRVRGLDVGADDYLPKPFALEELLARMRALLRRSSVTATERNALRFDDLTVDLGTREVARGGRRLELTRTEFTLLEMFLRSPRQVLTRAQILREVWGYEHDPGSNTLDVYVGYLRRKTEDEGGSRLLHTVRGVGFVLRADRPSG